MRRVASPKARTTPFWRNCTADTQWVHTHTWKHTHTFHTSQGDTRKDIKNDPCPSTKAELVGGGGISSDSPKELNLSPGRWFARCFRCRVVCAALVHAPERSHMQTQQCWNAISHSQGLISIVCRRKECPQKTQQGFLWLTGKTEVVQSETWELADLSLRCLKHVLSFKVVVERVREREALSLYAGGMFIVPSSWMTWLV